MPTDVLNMEAAVVELKHHVLDAVGACLRTFRQQTGVHPSEMRIRIEETTQLGDRTRRYVLGGVEVEFRL